MDFPSAGNSVLFPLEPKQPCVSEILRMHSPVFKNSRKPCEDYHLPGTDIVVKKGQVVNIQFDAIHYNPEYYPNPDQFDPTRFLPENRNKIVPFSYLPFSDGRRNCLGRRFALIEIKTAIIRLVYRFRIIRTANSNDKIKFRKFSWILSDSGGLPVGVELR